MPRDLRGFIPSLGITVVRLYIHFLQFIYYYMMLTHLMNIFFNFSRNIDVHIMVLLILWLRPRHLEGGSDDTYHCEYLLLNLFK